MKSNKSPKFRKEIELCAAFISDLPEEWKSYAETAGFDILLVRSSDGVQIGVEAKLALNLKVISQAMARNNYWDVAAAQPDFRAVLIPEYAPTEGAQICRQLGITVIRMRHPDHKPGWFFGHGRNFDPELPSNEEINEKWWDHWPATRCDLPDYVPDVAAGASGPVKLSLWKVRAIKISVLLDRRGRVTRADFKALGIDATRWIGRSGWLEKGENGKWVRGKFTPNFRDQHPSVYAQIEADYEKWAPADSPNAHQVAML